MLHYKTIEPGVLDLLKKLQLIDEFNELRLVGGTSLALQIGHRNSIDIDLFGTLDSDEIEINRLLSKIGSLTILKKSKNINIFLIDGIKVDLVNYPYPWIDSAISKDNLRLAGTKDIAAMKLAAITGRGTRKDFIDLSFLLQIYSLKEMLGFYKQKYSDASEILVLKSMTYFDDADQEADPRMFLPMNWVEVKDVIKSSMEEYLSLL